MICSHCGLERVGNATITVPYPPGIRTFWLCHPDAGMDCYHRVTVYQHRIENCPCTPTDPPDRHRDPEHGYLSHLPGTQMRVLLQEPNDETPGV